MEIDPDLRYELMELLPNSMTGDQVRQVFAIIREAQSEAWDHGATFGNGRTANPYRD